MNIYVNPEESDTRPQKYEGWFYCNERKCFYRWNDFIEY